MISGTSSRGPWSRITNLSKAGLWRKFRFHHIHRCYSILIRSLEYHSRACIQRVFVLLQTAFCYSLEVLRLNVLRIKRKIFVNYIVCKNITTRHNSIWYNKNIMRWWILAFSLWSNKIQIKRKISVNYIVCKNITRYNNI